MKVEFTPSFLRDLKRIREKAVAEKVMETICKIESAERFDDLPNLKKLRAVGNAYRIRIGDFRMGLMLENEIIVLVRFLHRKDIYRYFP